MAVQSKRGDQHGSPIVIIFDDQNTFHLYGNGIRGRHGRQKFHRGKGQFQNELRATAHALADGAYATSVKLYKAPDNGQANS